MTHDVIVVGAGISGLSLARELRARGRAPLVLERARGVGGRCATRRLEGQPVDHGVAFLHGHTPRFVDELAGVKDAVAIADWPRAREGTGVPCQPDAFDGRTRRVALADGVSRLAKHLARGLDVRLEAEVEALGLAAEPGPRAGRIWEVRLGSGDRLQAKAVALTMPAPSVITLLRRLDPQPAGLAPILPLLGLIRLLPCLTVIARYPVDVAAPAWEASFPRDSAAVHTILHDSSKRAGAPRLVLVVQARPRFSAAHMGDPVETWTRSLLDQAAMLHGEWAARPELVQSHIWRDARVAAGTELAAPLAVRLDGGAMLGIAGDGFHEGGGVEGAWHAGFALAARLLETPPGRA
jgi:hypothetical protein